MCSTGHGANAFRWPSHSVREILKQKAITESSLSDYEDDDVVPTGPLFIFDPMGKDSTSSASSEALQCTMAQMLNYLRMMGSRSQGSLLAIGIMKAGSGGWQGMPQGRVTSEVGWVVCSFHIIVCNPVYDIANMFYAADNTLLPFTHR